jgi:hypothetical protein
MSLSDQSLADYIADAASIGSGIYALHLAYKGGSISKNAAYMIGGGFVVIAALAYIETNAQATTTGIAPTWGGATSTTAQFGPDMFYVAPIATNFAPVIGRVYALHTATGVLSVQIAQTTASTVGGTVVGSTDPNLPMGAAASSVPNNLLWSVES